MKRWIVLGIAGIGAWVLGGMPVTGSAQHAHPGVSGVTERSPYAPSIPDVWVMDQHGQRRRFYSDLVRGRTVAIQFIFTSCTTVCPVLGHTFARVQERLGDRVGRDIRLISVSVDPENDTPDRLRAWGERFHVGPGWTLVTGRRTEIERLLRALGAYTGSREGHLTLVLIGSADGRRWVRVSGFQADALAEQVRQVADGVP
jgi:protein SCO1/2